jgi:LPXTG-motif cell wall-anchored protein
VLVAAASLAAAPAAVAQDDGELSPTPPSLGENGENGGNGDRRAPKPAAPLPDTGADVPTMALLGLGLLVSGIGLRLRTVDDRIF